MRVPHFGLWADGLNSSKVTERSSFERCKLWRMSVHQGRAFAGHQKQKRNYLDTCIFELLIAAFVISNCAAP